MHVIHKNGHSNWNILKPELDPDEIIDSSTRAFKWEIQGYAIHTGYIDYLDERKDMHVEVVNLEHEGRGNLNSGSIHTENQNNGGCR